MKNGMNHEEISNGNKVAIQKFNSVSFIKVMNLQYRLTIMKPEGFFLFVYYILQTSVATVYV